MPALERRKAALNAKIMEYQKELDELKVSAARCTLRRAYTFGTN